MTSSHPVVFITGSAKRLGAHSASYLHQRGYNIVLHYHHSADAAQALTEKLNSQRAHSAYCIQGDLADAQSIEQLAEHAQQAFGRLDVLINNASAFYPTPFGHISHNDWQALVGSNMQGPLFLSQACLSSLEQSKGQIINMLDIHAERPLKHHTLYCMAKAALVSMTYSLAQELAPDIRVNGVSPGAILWPSTGLSAHDQQAVLQEIPLGTLGTPDDIAQAIDYLLNAPYVNGQIIKVDGGRSIASHSKA